MRLNRFWRMNRVMGNVARPTNTAAREAFALTLMAVSRQFTFTFLFIFVGVGFMWICCKLYIERTACGKLSKFWVFLYGLFGLVFDWADPRVGMSEYFFFLFSWEVLIDLFACANCHTHRGAYAWMRKKTSMGCVNGRNREIFSSENFDFIREMQSMVAFRRIKIVCHVSRLLPTLRPELLW